MTDQHPVEFQAVVDSGQVLVTVKGKAGGMIAIVMGSLSPAAARNLSQQLLTAADEIERK